MLAASSSEQSPRAGLDKALTWSDCSHNLRAVSCLSAFLLQGLPGPPGPKGDQVSQTVRGHVWLAQGTVSHISPACMACADLAGAVKCAYGGLHREKASRESLEHP